MVRLDAARLRTISALPRGTRTGAGRPSSNPAMRCSSRTCGGITSSRATAFNVLVNYWWDDTPPWNGSPFEALCTPSCRCVRCRPSKRAIWRTVFEHHIFQTGGDPVAHLTPRQRGIQGTPSPQIADHPCRCAACVEPAVAAALEEVVRPDHRAPHVRHRRSVEPQAFLRLPEMPADDVVEHVRIDFRARARTRRCRTW